MAVVVVAMYSSSIAFICPSITAACLADCSNTTSFCTSFSDEGSEPKYGSYEPKYGNEEATCSGDGGGGSMRSLTDSMNALDAAVAMSEAERELERERRRQSRAEEIRAQREWLAWLSSPKAPLPRGTPRGASASGRKPTATSSMAAPSASASAARHCECPARHCECTAVSARQAADRRASESVVTVDAAVVTCVC